MRGLRTHTFCTRAPTPDDAPAVAGLMNVCAVAETGALRATVEQVRESWRRPGFDLAQDARLVVAPAGRVVGYGEVWDCQPGGTPCFWSCVHPGQEAKIGSYLLAWAENRVQQVLAGAGGGPCVTLRCGAASANRAAWRLLAQHGFRLVRRVWCVAGELSGPGWPQHADSGAFSGDARALFRYDLYEKELCIGATWESTAPCLQITF